MSEGKNIGLDGLIKMSRDSGGGSIEDMSSGSNTVVGGGSGRGAGGHTADTGVVRKVGAKIVSKAKKKPVIPSKSKKK